MVVTEVGAETPIYAGDQHVYDFGADPLSIHVWAIRVPSCTFTGPGLFSIEFVYNEVPLGNFIMRVEEST